MTKYVYLDKKSLEELANKEKKSKGCDTLVELRRITLPVTERGLGEKTIIAPTIAYKKPISGCSLSITPPNIINNKSELFEYCSANSILEEWGDNYPKMLKKIKNGESVIKIEQIEQIRKNYIKRHKVPVQN